MSGFDLGRLSSPPRRILAVKLSSFGDIVHVTPCLRALRQRFPRAEIVVAVESRWAEVLRNNPNVNRLLESSSRARPSPAYLWEIHGKITAAVRRDGPFDLAIDFQGNRRSAAWIYLSRARIKAGRGQPRPGWKAALAPDLSRHAVEVCADICSSIGIPIEDLNPEIFPEAADEHSLDKILDDVALPREGFVLFNPFSRWKSKAWPVERAAAFLTAFGGGVVLTGGPGDEGPAEELIHQTGPGTVTPLTGRLTLGQAFCLYRRARLMISCDSGPMHAAAALGTPVIALFGPTHPERTGPWGDGHTVLQARRPPIHHAYRDDPEGSYMNALDSDTVLAAVALASGG